jgi:predicted tellurium resistance membrane protein TerC
MDRSKAPYLMQLEISSLTILSVITNCYLCARYRFFTVVDGITMATPLLLCLVCVELSDVVFAFDSVPAVRLYLLQFEDLDR